MNYGNNSQGSSLAYSSNKWWSSGKTYSPCTEEEKRKRDINIKSNNFIIIFLDDSKLYDFLHGKTDNEMWDAFEKIYGVSPSIEHEKMNARGKEDNDTSHICFSKFINIGNFIGNCITNKYLRIKNLKFNSTLKSLDKSLMNFRKNKKEWNHREDEQTR